MFKELMRDRITVRRKNGETYPDVHASVQRNRVYTDRIDIPIEPGDEIIRKTPAGVEEVHVVDDPGFHKGMGGIPDTYQMTVRPAKKATRSSAAVIYNISGPNARFNINSVDASTNIVQQDPSELFHALREAIQTELLSTPEYQQLLESVQELENAIGKKDFAHKYASFMALAADHITVLCPFIPALTQLLGLG